MLVPMILIMVMFYFVLIRPQRKQQKAQEQMRSNLRVGDKVITVGGVHGLVSGMTDKTVSVKVADGLSMKFDRSAIATVTDSKADATVKTLESTDETEESEETKES